MSIPETSVQGRKRRRAWVAGAGALVLVAIIVLVISLTRGSSQPEAAGTASDTSSAASGPPAASGAATASSKAQSSATKPAAAAKPRPSAPVLAVPLPPADAKVAELHAKDFMAAGAKALAAPSATPSPGDFKAIAIGSAFDAMMANSQDFANNGWHQVGAPTVAWVNVTGYQPSANPPQATLDVCVDSSKVNVVTADGSVVKQGTAADRSVNVLTLVKTDGKWLVSRQGFPANPAC